jgi:hypothetical protein
MSDPQFETPSRPDGFPSQTSVAQSPGMKVTINPELAGDSAVPEPTDAPQEASVDPADPDAAESHTEASVDPWEGLDAEGWTVTTPRGLMLGDRTYGIGQVLDAEVVREHFSLFSLQKLVNAGQVAKADLAALSPTPVDPWSVLGHTASAGVGDTTEVEDGEGSEAEQRHEGGTPEDGQHRQATGVAADPGAAPPTVLNPGVSNAVSTGPVPVVPMAEEPGADDIEFDPAAASVAEVKRVVEDNPEIASAVLNVELAGRNRTALVRWLQERLG